MLGFEEPPVPLLELVGGKGQVQKKMMAKFSSGGSESKMQVLTQERILVTDIPPMHIKQSDGLMLVNVGKILHSLEGCACPMGVLTREFLSKLSLERKQAAIVDMEAGVEHFGRGVGTSIDKVLAVVEPSFESLQLASKIVQLAVDAGVRKTSAILNKITSDAIAAKVKDELKKRGIEPIGTVRYDAEIFQATLEGRHLSNCAASEDIKNIADVLLLEA